MNTLRNVLLSEDGGTAIEQGLVAALFAGIILGVVSTLGLAISNIFTNLTEVMAAALRLDHNFLIPVFNRTP